MRVLSLQGKTIFLNLKTVFPPPLHPCISLTSVPAKKEQLFGGPPLISYLISWMNNVPFPSSSGLAGGPQCYRLMTALRAKTAVGKGWAAQDPRGAWRPQILVNLISWHSLTSTPQNPARETEALQRWVLLFKNGDCL